MKQSFISFLKHLGIFLIVEIVFVLLIFREFPPISLLSIAGILHTSYWIVVVISGFIRSRYAHRIWQKILCTYLPVVYHVFIHIYVWLEAIHEIEWDAHDEHSIAWLIIATLSTGLLIALGEYRLHRSDHCETHHQKVHIHCHDVECTDSHEKI